MRLLPTGSNSSRRAVVSLVALALSWGLARSALAEELEVPVRTQAELVAKVAGYDRNFRTRAGGEARVLVVARAGDAESERLAALLKRELSAQGSIGGLPTRVSSVTFAGSEALAATIKEQAAAIVYLSSGLNSVMAAVASALAGVSVLSAAVSSSYTPLGAVLGFELSSGRPKLVINLAQAKKQAVSFTPELLRLAKVIQ